MRLAALAMAAQVKCDYAIILREVLKNTGGRPGRDLATSAVCENDRLTCPLGGVMNAQSAGVEECLGGDPGARHECYQQQCDASDRPVHRMPPLSAVGHGSGHECA